MTRLSEIEKRLAECTPGNYGKFHALWLNAPSDLAYLLDRIKKAEGALKFYAGREVPRRHLPQEDYSEDGISGAIARAYFEEFS